MGYSQVCLASSLHWNRTRPCNKTEYSLEVALVSVKHCYYSGPVEKRRTVISVSVCWVCLSVRTQLHVQSLSISSCMLPMAVAYSLPLAAFWYVAYFWFCGWRMFAHNGQEQATRKSAYSKWLARWQHRFHTVAYTRTDSPRGSTEPRRNLMSTILFYIEITYNKGWLE